MERSYQSGNCMEKKLAGLFLVEGKMCNKDMPL